MVTQNFNFPPLVLPEFWSALTNWTTRWYSAPKGQIESVFIHAWAGCVSAIQGKEHYVRLCLSCAFQSKVRRCGSQVQSSSAMKVTGLHSRGGVGVLARNLADAAPPCTGRASIITNACDVLGEGRICFKALFSICWIDSNLQGWLYFWLLRGKLFFFQSSNNKTRGLILLRLLCKWHVKYSTESKLASTLMSWWGGSPPQPFFDSSIEFPCWEKGSSLRTFYPHCHAPMLLSAAWAISLALGTTTSRRIIQDQGDGSAGQSTCL